MWLGSTSRVTTGHTVGADGRKIQRLDIGSGKEAEDFKRALDNATFTVTSVEAKPARRNPPRGARAMGGTTCPSPTRR